ncbi:lipopolysaccharide biosynthesis protein [Streptomyces sp. NPDC127084]|uniref:lipopolysaccharide biosynthesis protein n=1 Tax=Streptomyces sp. NPDC127084 TaxID=3347133 RepID=UPI00365F5717
MTDTARLSERGHAPAAPGASGTTQDGGRDSLFRNAYALMLSTGVSAALGLGFWLVAARYYTEEAVGQGSAAIAAMRLLASVTATTMIGAVVRYVPKSGRATAGLVWRVYAASSAVVSLVCAGFLLTLDLWGPSYAPLHGPTAGLVFTAACVAWALLTLQDGVLTGLRKAVWVPVGNAVFSLGKLLLLAGFAAALPVLGVFVSWAAAIALSVLPLGWLVFRRLIPRQAAADHDREPPRLRDIGRFLAGDSVGALFSLAMINLVPVMVAVRFDAAHNGFFYIAYTVGGTMEFMAINMASSLTAHASHSPESLADGVRGALRRMTLLLVPVVLVLVVFAPRILAPFGPDYAEHGTTVLRLLAAAALPRVVVELYIGVLRVQGRTGALAVLQGAMCALVLGSTAVLLGPLGISGAGLSVLLSMTAVALAAAPGIRAALAGRAPRPRRAARRPWRRREVPGYGTTWARQAAAEAEAAYRRGGGTAARRQDGGSRLVFCLWLLLALAAALFWIPLTRAAPVGPGPLSGVELVRALPQVSVGAWVLLVVVHCAALAVRRLRPELLAAALLTTVAALHTAPALLGVRPRPAQGPWVAELLPRDDVLAVLPFVIQLLCLGLTALSLAAVGTPARITAGAVWVLAVVGWAAQDAFAGAPLPVLLGCVAVAAGTSAYRRLRGWRPGDGVSGSGRSV